MPNASSQKSTQKLPEEPAKNSTQTSAQDSTFSPNSQHATNPKPSSDQKRRIIGLTGGIGMGKSTVSTYLHTGYEIPVLDADVLARDAVECGSSILQDITDRYGPSILRPDGTLNRRQLGEIIFNLSAERLWLDQQIHPYVRDRIETALASDYQSSPIVVLAIPLLFEARMTDLATEIWVVHCPRSQQIERLLKRSQSDTSQSGQPPQPAQTLTRAQVESRINAQLDIQKKIGRADVVLDNSGNQSQLFQAIDYILRPDKS